MTDKASKAHFRPDIEGLRAVAIGAVLLFHARVPGATGGFIGVDVFFVISGFLITGLLVREWNVKGRIDLVNFYSRRFRRLLPASLIVIAITVVASYLVLSSVRFPSVAGDGAASALYVANIRFATEATDYLGAEVAPSPFLHFWSLGVEEQFYLFWPLMILLALRIMAVGRLGILLAAIAIVSLSAAVIWTDISAPWAFFSLPTRAWQLAVGALIAIGVLRLPTRVPPVVAAAMVWAGLAIIAAATVMLGPDTPYPGTSAIVPVLGAALVIIGGKHSMTLPSRVLSTSVPRWLGRISYSLYLWHWPLLILVPIAIDMDSLPFNLVLVGVAMVLAWISTEYIETPIRQGRVLRLTAPRSVGVALTSSVLVAAGSITVGLAVQGPSSGPPETAAVVRTGAASLELPEPIRTGPVPEDIVPALSQAYWDLPAGYDDGCHIRDFPVVEIDPQNARNPGCTYGQTTADTTVMLLGDSHAQQWLPALESIADERGWRLKAITKGGCPMVEAPVWNTVLKRYFRECDQWHERVLEMIEGEKPAIVFLASADMYQVVDEAGQRIEEGATEIWRDGLEQMVQEVVDRAPRVVVLADTPRLGYDPVDCLAASDSIDECDASTTSMVDRDYAELEAEAVDEAGADIISATDWLCSDEDCPLVRGPFLVYRDRHHLTATFAAVLSERLSAALDDVQGGR